LMTMSFYNHIFYRIKFLLLWLIVMVGKIGRRTDDGSFLCDAFQPIITRPAAHRQQPFFGSTFTSWSDDSLHVLFARRSFEGVVSGSFSSSNDDDNNNSKRRPTGSLGILKKKKIKSNKPLLNKKERQRTGNGEIDSTIEAMINDPENEKLQVLEANRGNKVVTIVRGMTTPMDERKKILKGMKKSFGAGGTLVDGVLEIQGAYANRAVEILQKQGYAKARKIGK